MMAIFQNKMLMMILGGIVVAGVIWYSFLRDRGGEALLQTTDLTEATEADSDIVGILLELRAVSLSGTIFSDPAFLRLKDFGSAIIPEPVGRTNPFAPLSGAAAASTAVGSRSGLQTSATSSTSTPR